MRKVIYYPKLHISWPHPVCETLFGSGQDPELKQGQIYLTRGFWQDLPRHLLSHPTPFAEHQPDHSPQKQIPQGTHAYLINEMGSSRLVRASDSQRRSRNCPGSFDPSILRHSGIWRAADETVLDTVPVHQKTKKIPLLKYLINVLPRVADQGPGAFWPLDPDPG